MEDALAALGMLFMLFLVVATASEQIVEALRGVLQYFGFTKLKGGVTVAEATKLSAEFMPAGSDARAKAEAMLAVARDYPVTLADRQAQIEQAVASITTALATLPMGSQAITEATAAVNKLALEVSTAVEKTEQVRQTALRLISLTVCFILCAATRFNALAIVAAVFPDLAGVLGATGADGALDPVKWGAGLLATAVAASAGSSYWHDVLDRLRATKTAVSQIQTAAASLDPRPQ